MSEGAKRLLIDTNVWLDYFLPARSGHQQARMLFEGAFGKDVDLLFASTTVKDVFFIASSSYKRELHEERGRITEADSRAINVMCWAIAASMEEMATPVGVDASDLWLAEKYRSLHKDLEDNLILAAAQRAKADVLVTCDEGLIKHAPLPALTPLDAIAYVSMEL
ncbi:type II toxin-antitoxin system VapC family toxin [Collinsella provencensis]|uniref:type II toxin-antitoxin system VapC family toxin n=1 Tax=Collinsella provencensis TaxID=1937461 RepID=UPI0018FE4270|nr:PIN domain-containing protein [Collinsella provencensis]